MRAFLLYPNSYLVIFRMHDYMRKHLHTMLPYLPRFFPQVFPSIFLLSTTLSRVYTRESGGHQRHRNANRILTILTATFDFLDGKMYLKINKKLVNLYSSKQRPGRRGLPAVLCRSVDTEWVNGVNSPLSLFVRVPAANSIKDFRFLLLQFANRKSKCVLSLGHKK